MADINITITIPDAYVARVSNVIDFIYPGREAQVPVPTKVEWWKKMIIANLKHQVLTAERQLTAISEIEII